MNVFGIKINNEKYDFVDNDARKDFSNFTETIDLTKLGKTSETSIFELSSTDLLNYTTFTIEGSTGFVGGLYVDSTNGKWGKNNESWAIQVGAGTVCYVPAENCGSIKITVYSEDKALNIGKRTVSVVKGENTIDFTSDDVIELNGINYVPLKFDTLNYINSIKATFEKTSYQLVIDNNTVNVLNDLIVQNVTKVLGELHVGYSRNSGSVQYSASDLKNIVEINGTTGSFDEIEIDATNGKWGKNNSDSWPLYLNAGTVFYLPYKGDGTIDFTIYNNANSNVTVNGKAYTTSCSISEAECVDEKIKVSIINGTTYINSIDYEYVGNLPLVSIKDGNIYHGGNRTDDLKNQKVPFFKEITEAEYEALADKDPDVIYLVKE